METFGLLDYENAREPSEEELSEYLEKIESDRKKKITENLESWK